MSFHRAAFQFGIKMSEGRKTRRAGPKDEKAKLDRDWQKISQVTIIAHCVGAKFQSNSFPECPPPHQSHLKSDCGGTEIMSM